MIFILEVLSTHEGACDSFPAAFTLVSGESARNASNMCIIFMC